MRDKVLQQKKWPWPVLFLVLTMAFVALGYLYYLNEMQSAGDHAYEDLHAIAELKIIQIQEWRRERIAGLRMLVASPYFSEAVAEFVQRPDAGDSKSRLRQRLTTVRNDYRYEDALLAGLGGEILLSAKGESRTLDPTARQTVEDALSSGRAVFGALYRCSVCGRIHIDAAAPILGAGDRPVAVLVFRIDPETDLYPLIQSWPTPSKTAETLIVRKDGDHVLFLNQLRHRADRALRLREPLTKTYLPAVRAVLGTHDHFQGNDYRGVEVFAGIHPVPGTPWFMVAKVDKDEILAEVHQEARLISLFVVMLVALAGVGTGLVFVSRQKGMYAELYQAQRERSAIQEELKATLYSIGDAVITTDTEGYVRHMNRVAEGLTGWTETEANGRSLGEVFRIVNEETREETEGPVERVLREGVVVGLANHTVLIAQDGKETPIADSGAPIRDETGEIIGVVLVFRDQTEERKAHEELVRAKKNWEDIFQAIGHVTFIVDPKGTILAANRAATRAIGKPEEQVLGRKCYELFHNLDHHPDGCPLARVGSTGDVVTEEMEVEALGGYYLVSCTPVVEDSGVVERVIHIATDITARKRAEEALRDSEQMLRSLVLATPVGLCLTQDRTVKWANDEWERMFGFTDAREYVGKPTSIMYRNEEEYFTAREAIYRSAENGVTGESRTEFMRRDGTQFEGYLRSTYLDPADPSKGTVSAISDLTEITEAEQARRESERRYKAFFEDSRDPVFVTSRDGTFTEVNQSFCDLFGYERKDLESLKVRQTYADPADGKGFQEAVEKTGSTKEFPMRLRKKDGSIFQGLFTASVRCGDTGEIVGYQGIIRDVTEQRQLERQLLHSQKMEAIGTLAGGVAHDFNNILQVVLGYSELLLADKEQGDEESDDLKKIFYAAKTGADLVQRLLMFGRKSEPNLVPADLNKQIVQVEKLLRRTIPRMVDIHLDLAEDLPRIYADPSQVEQVLMNLAVNGRDAMPDGGRLTVRTSPVSLDEEYCRFHVEAAPGDYVMLEFSDTGQGMDRKTVEHIFEPFFTTKEIGRGTGLGLAMVHGIVKQHNGHITVYSEVGKGTSFRVYLPAIESEAEKDVENSGITPAIGNETILLVDDEDLVRELGAAILTKHGYAVLQAANGREALEVFKNKRSEIALVVLDLIMPEMGGMECLRELLKIDSNLKVMIASGYSAGASVEETIQMGAKGFVSKPFRVNELLGDVRRVLDQG
ncbi:MAG: PAS domain S-box protein [Pseudomonadota bacterium]